MVIRNKIHFQNNVNSLSLVLSYLESRSHRYNCIKIVPGIKILFSPCSFYGCRQSRCEIFGSFWVIISYKLPTLIQNMIQDILRVLYLGHVYIMVPEFYKPV